MNHLDQRACQFIYQKARPLDLARWQYHFEGGSQEAVLKALAYYQNEEGGFGHGLEADAWNPYSSPIQTWTATEILREIHLTDASHPMIQGILRYLESGKDFDGKRWYWSVRQNNEYPHASWWHTEKDSTNEEDYNPTASLAGFIIRFAAKDSALYKLGCTVAKEAFNQLMSGARENGMHTLACYVQLLTYMEEANVREVIDLERLREKLQEQIKQCITTDTTLWGHAYICKPSQFIQSKESCFYEENREMAEYEVEFIQNTQEEDGSWAITWAWDRYPNEWAISKNWWKANGIILNKLYLKGLRKQ